MKYKLTDNKKEIEGLTLYQIQALKDFGSVKKGDLGGWIERENNLSQEGNAWVSGDAWVSGNARVYGNAWVSGNAWVYGNAWVSGDAWVSGNARVYDNAWVYGDAWVSGNARVYGNLKLTKGYFFGYKKTDEELFFIPFNDGYQLIAKGDVKFTN